MTDNWSVDCAQLIIDYELQQIPNPSCPNRLESLDKRPPIFHMIAHSENQV